MLHLRFGLNIATFCNMTQCSLVDTCHPFRGNCCLLLPVEDVCQDGGKTLVPIDQIVRRHILESSNLLQDAKE